MEKIKTTEQISALADGALRGDEFARAVEAANADPAAREAWHTYHLIGDVLRSSELARGGDSNAFALKLRERLAAEAKPPVAIESIAARASAEPLAARFDAKTAANDGSFRWKLVAGLASVAAVAAVGWNVVGSGPAAQQPQLAAAPGQGGATLAVATGAPGGAVMIRDPRLDEFLAAHRRLGGASALQMPAGFLRSATSEGAAR